MEASALKPCQVGDQSVRCPLKCAAVGSEELQILLDERRELRPADRAHLGGDGLTVLAEHYGIPRVSIG